MGQMPGMMPMGMGMPMMGMPMMGMPMMNPMMGMPMMNPMMGMGGNAPNMGNAGPASTVGPMAPVSPVAGPAMGATLAQPSAKSPPILGTTGGLMPKLDPPCLAPGSLEPGRVPMAPAVPAMTAVPAVPVVSSGLQRERSRSRDAERSQAEAPMVEEKEEPAEKEPPRCHLHNTKKPNAKCKFCQKWIACQSQSQADKAEKEDGKEEKAKVQAPEIHEEEDYSRRTFKCSTLLKDQIFGSSYFKSLLEVSDLQPLTDEIAKYADTLDVYNSGNNVHPSCFICQVGNGDEWSG